MAGMTNGEHNLVAVARLHRDDGRKARRQEIEGVKEEFTNQLKAALKDEYALGFYDALVLASPELTWSIPKREEPFDLTVADVELICQLFGHSVHLSVKPGSNPEEIPVWKVSASSQRPGGSLAEIPKPVAGDAHHFGGALADFLLRLQSAVYGE